MKIFGFLFTLLYSAGLLAQPDTNQLLNEVVVSGSLKPVSRAESPVAIEVFSPEFFRANPTASLIESFQYVNGVRSQLNCNVCNTADIRINGLPGPYTMVLIDGMPIVSGLATVYGLSGIPQALIERIEIVKGPSSTLFGSEAVGGVINIITKKAKDAPVFTAEVFGTSYREWNTDLGFRFAPNKNVQTLLGLNLFRYGHPADKNGDNFTDVALQKRVSLFNTWQISLPKNASLNLAGRLFYENRWGGELQWNPVFYGTDSVYGEAITTQRWEVLSDYRLPGNADIRVQVSANGHKQRSAYGTTRFDADQVITFAQLLWRQAWLKRHELLSGLSLRHTFYDDNTVATEFVENGHAQNNPSFTWLPGIFMQDEFALSARSKVLLGARYDYNSQHGSIFSPRANVKITSRNKRQTLRFGLGNGYRVASVFTEDHAALTGARQVVFAEALNPETSWNFNTNFTHAMLLGRTFLSFDVAAFYTRFSNRIVADYDTDPNKIIYTNLVGYAVNRGFAVNLQATLPFGLSADVGATAVNVFLDENGQREVPYFTEQFSAVYKIQYPFASIGVVIDLTGNLIGPMRLPRLSPLDPRPEYSPWWGSQNVQVTKMLKHGMQIFGGVKNYLNYRPAANSIARPHDPFDKLVQFDAAGNALPTAENPFALTFDPSYAYAPMQGIRFFLGLRYHID